MENIDKYLHILFIITAKDMVNKLIGITNTELSITNNDILLI